MQVRVRPSALAALDEAVGDEGRSVWLRSLISWALSSGWRPGQDWQRKPYVSVDAHQAVADEMRREFAAKEALLPTSRMEVARAALASVQMPVASHPAWADEDHDFGDDWEPA